MLIRTRHADAVKIAGATVRASVLRYTALSLIHISQMVNIRVTAVLDGVDPMESADAEPAGNAVSFIRDNADYITFKPGKERDTITIVCFLS